MNRSLRGSLLLFVTTVIWGGAFVAQQLGGESIGPAWFNGLRILLAAAALLCVILILEKKKILPVCDGKQQLLRLLRDGSLCGIMLFFATNLQQAGLQMTTVAKAGFISALYVIFVPVGGLFFGKKMPVHLWFCVLAAAFGMYLLCIENSFSLSMGDLLELLCAVFFAAQIMLVGKFGKQQDGLKLSCVQFWSAGLLTVLYALIFFPNELSLEGIRNGLVPLLYSGILSCGIGYTFQTIAQKDLPPTIASLIMCLESVFALLFGFLLLGERLNIRQLAGCALMLGAVLFAQLPAPGKLDETQK